MKCSNCNYENRAGVKFCEQCGNSLAKLQKAEKKQRFCPNCGEPNPLQANFCIGCGTSFSEFLSDHSMSSPSPQTQHSQIQATSSPAPSFWYKFAKAIVLASMSFLIVSLVWNFLGLSKISNPVFKDRSVDAEAMAWNFVQENYPELALAERTVYVANIQGTDYYVVDFVLDEPFRPPAGVRVLVDRMLRTVMVYEHIEG